MTKTGMAIFLQLFLWHCSFGQAPVLSKAITYPFKMETLSTLSYRKDSIMPKYDGSRFHYINTKTHQKIGSRTFELAYPHNGFAYAIVKESGRFGIVDRNGEFKIDPKSDTIRLSDELSDGYHVMCQISHPKKTKEAKLFNLYTGLIEEPSIVYIKPARPPYHVLKGRNGKYGVIEEYWSKNRLRKKTIFRSVFDTVYQIDFSGFTVAQKKGKIGVVLAHSKQIAFKFHYRNFILGNQYSFKTDSGWMGKQFIGLDTAAKWEYYNLKKVPQLMLTSAYQCIKLGGMKINTGIGIIKRNGKYNVLLANGTVLSEDYDYLSSNGGIAILDKKVYLYDEEGQRHLYYY